MSSSAKKEAILRQFRSITNATPQDAHRILKANSYRLEQATNAFFSDEQAQLNAASSSNSINGVGGTGKLDKKAEKELKDNLNALFDQFRDDPEDSAEDKITIEGAIKMCEALQISPEDVVFLPLSFYLKSPSIGTFERNDYVQGWKTLDLSDTLEKQRKTLENLRQELKQNKPIRLERLNEERLSSAKNNSSNNSTSSGANSSNKGLFERVYDYTYGFARREGQKSLALENALAFWDLLLPWSPTFKRPDNPTGNFTQQQLEMWKKFLETQTNNRAISKDSWTQFLDFTKEIDQEFSNHDFDAAWPSVIDDFVLWAQKNKDSFTTSSNQDDDPEGMDTS